MTAYGLRPTAYGLLGVALLIGTASGPVVVVHGQGRVALVRLPAGGVQPQVSVDERGLVHVVYLTGDAAASDLNYSTISDAGTFSAPVRVNSEPGSAIATGTIRGAQLAIGRNGRVHVAWNGSSRAASKASTEGMPMLYSRWDPQHRFEAQRSLASNGTGLDGGGAIAADQNGRVWVAWHAGGSAPPGEQNRRVWVAASTNDGATFTADRPVSPPEAGACGCCGMDALVDRTGALYLLFRSARDTVHRDTYLLTSTDLGRSFASTKLHEWNIGGCPMSSFSFAQGQNGVLAAWETDGQVHFARVEAAAKAVTAIQPSGTAGKRRHPSLAVNARGEILLAWSEGTGWQKGGTLAWQVFDRDGRPSSEVGRADGMPVWGFAAAYAKPDGGFAIVY